jgi:GAF domain-containing protein
VVNDPLPPVADADRRRAHYREVRAEIDALLVDEDDFVAAMATVVCALHHGFAWFDWTGFYRVVAPGMLAVGPYQGGHGCLRIPFDRGVCGAAARTKTTQRVADVTAFAGHIACSSTTRSEIVVPILDARGETIALLDVDSDDPDAFAEIDQVELEDLCAMLGARYGGTLSR